MTREAFGLGLAAALAALGLHLAAQKRRLGAPRGPAERIRLRTPDGAALALYRYPAAGPAEGREPVLMLSGYGVNRCAIDFDDRFSWARRFAAAGHETWLLEVRGSGESKRAGRLDGSFDDYLLDARTALAHVLAASGAEKVHWVGFSLGGMLLYAALGTESADRLRSGVAVEAPASLEGYPMTRASRALLDLMGRFSWPGAIPYRWPCRLLLPLLPLWYETPLFGAWMNLANLDRALLSKLIYQTFDDVPTALALQFRDWTGCDTLRSRDGRTDYLAGLGETRVPLLLVTGTGDFAARARLALPRLGGAPVRWVECLKANGFSADYGHADLIFGHRAPEEVFPHLLDWVSRHDPAAASLAIK